VIEAAGMKGAAFIDTVRLMCYVDGP